MSDIYWILSPKNILRERKNEFRFFEEKKFISVFLNIIILSKYQNNKIQYISVFLNTFNIIIKWINLIKLKKNRFKIKFCALLFKFISWNKFAVFWLFNYIFVYLYKLKIC